MTTFLDAFYGPNAGYVYELYEQYLRDPASVDSETREFFQTWQPDNLPSRWEPAAGNGTTAAGLAPSVAGSATAPATAEVPVALAGDDLQRVVGASELGHAIRARGHLAAQIDPLGGPPPGDPALELDRHGLTETDLARLPAIVVGGRVGRAGGSALDAVHTLRRLYSGTIGYEFDHITAAAERRWLRDQVESERFASPYDDHAKRALLERLTEVEALERYLHRAYVGQTRFSIEGVDILVPMLDELLSRAAEVGIPDVVLGMAHRGRLNVLAHVLNKSYEAIMAEFHGPDRPKSEIDFDRADDGWLGDVKYHLGGRRAFRGGNAVQVFVTLAPNPSHLEFVNPVVEGMARAAQERRDQPGAPAQNDRVSLPVLIHGDAAFPGQGIVPETLNLSRLAGYRTGGTIHVIANNQLGFTTEPSSSRSTLYASDLAKGFEIPIVHVNADDVDACLAAVRLAHAYRERYGKDFLIDLVGYRRYGHNEGDEPSFTQPELYERVAAHPTVRELFARELDRERVVPLAEAEELLRAANQRLETARQAIVTGEAKPETGAPPVDAQATRLTAVTAETLRALNAELQTPPPDFTINPKLERLLQRRRTALDSAGTIDWAHAETLAFASILAEGQPIRLTGQDVERGTFSQRHLVLHEPGTGRTHVPLQSLSMARASFAAYNSPLSENAALGFEFGYSICAAGTLVVWEAQYGDFANGAQVIIDQFVVSARSKWGQSPSLVMLLPHGHEGQGPEHSSGRPERFLQLAADGNIRVVNCTTAAQYFHLLRRHAAQLSSDPRPLIVMTPKSLLRQPRAAARLEELAEGSFQTIIDDEAARDRADKVTRLLVCTGKVYVDLVSSPLREVAEHVAVVRIEELYPLPRPELRALVASYPNIREIAWVQEEPQNGGAWDFIFPRLHDLFGDDPRVVFVGRRNRASPAEGSAAMHAAEQLRIIEQAFAVGTHPGGHAKSARARTRAVTGHGDPADNLATDPHAPAPGTKNPTADGVTDAERDSRSDAGRVSSRGNGRAVAEAGGQSSRSRRAGRLAGDR